MPVSTLLLNFYQSHVNYSMITDFSGSNKAKEVLAIEDYVMGIN